MAAQERGKGAANRVMIASGPQRLRLLLASGTALTALAGMPVHANPEGGTVVAGQATIATPAPGHLVVQQGSARAVIDWQRFSIAPGEHTQFVQPSSSAIALNRVTGPDPSVIAGRLSANGRIVIQNEAGVTFSEGAQVSAASLLATTARIDAERLMATGEVVASAPGRVAGARVENRGEITVADSGVAALVGPEVRNAGRIVARQGRVVLGGAETYTIDLAGDGLVAFEVRDPVARAPAGGGPVVSNTGTIEAPGGQVLVSARVARGVVDEVIFAGGRIAATAVRQEGGAIVLGGGDAGTVTVAGHLDVSGREPGQRGGTVDVRGERIALKDGARIDASGRAGGGTARVGGDLRGQGPGPKAREVTVERGAAILADATAAGDGGRVIVWSEEVTRFWGEISARGGAEGGDGGFAEVSSKGRLDYRGLADLRATLGRVGVLLLDPTDLQIADTPSQDVTVGPVTQPTPSAPGPASVLNAADLQAQLALSDVVVTTVGSPDTGGTGAITVFSDLVIPTGRTLTLQAQGAVLQDLGSAITALGSANLTLQSGVGAGGAGDITLAGTIALGPSGQLVLDATGGGTGAGGAISQTGGSITAATLLAQAVGAVSINTAAVGTVAGSAGGAFSLTAGGALTVGTVAGVSGITTAGQPVTLATAGALTLTEAIAAGSGAVSLTAGTGALLRVDAPVEAGAVTAVADRIAVDAALGTGAATVDIATGTGTRPILLGTGAELGSSDADAAALAVNRDEFALLGAADATVRLRTTTGTITVSGTAGDPATGIALGGRSLILQTGSTSAGAIGQTGPVTGGVGSALAASAASGSVALTDPANAVGTIAGRAGGAGHVFRFTNAGALAVGTVGGGVLPALSGLATTGADVALRAAGTLSLDQGIAAGTGGVFLNTTAGGAVSQTAAAPIVAGRLDLAADGPVDLTAAANQVGTLVAITGEGLAFRNTGSLALVAHNLGSGAVTVSAEGAGSDLTIVADTEVPGVANAGAVTLTAADTLTLLEPVTAGTVASLAGGQVAIEATVAAPRVVVTADDLSIGPSGTLGTATLTEAVLRTLTAGRAISLGAAAAGTLSIDAVELGRIGLGANDHHLRIGSLGGADRPGEAATGTLTLRAGVDLAGRQVTLEAGEAGADVAQLAGAALSADSLIARSAQGSVLLGAADNAVGTFAGSAPGTSADVEFRGAGPVTVAALAHGTDAIVAGLTAGRTVRLASGFGSVQQTAAGRIEAQSLLAQAAFGDVDLTASAANSVGTVAGEAFSRFAYRAAADLTVGSVGPSAAFPGTTAGVSTAPPGAVTLTAAGDLALAAPVTAPGGTVRLQAGQDLTQGASGGIEAGALLARAGRDLLLDGADGTALPGAPGGTGGNRVDTLAAVAGRELWYRSAQGVTVGSVAGDALVAGAAGASGGADAMVRLAVTQPGGGLAVGAPIAGPAVELAADAMSLEATVGADAAAVVVRPFTAGRGIELGNLLPFDPGTLWLSAEAIDLLGGPTTTLRIGAVGGAAEAAAGAIVVRENLFFPVIGIRVNRAGAPGDARTLVLESGTGSITQTGPIAGGATATLVAVAPSGEVRLDDPGNDVGTIAGTAGAGGFRYRAGGSVIVGTVPSLEVGGAVPLAIAGRDGIVTPSAPISLLAAGDLAVEAPLDAGSGTLRLQAGGALTQGTAGALSAGALLARGGTVDLTGTDNRVGLLAGGSVAGLRVRHQGTLAVGSVAGDAVLPIAGEAGLRSLAFGAPISLRVEGGDLSLTQSVDAGAGPGGIVRLQADGTLSQTASAAVIAEALLARGDTVLLDGTNLVGAVAGEAQAEFRLGNAADVTVGDVAADGTLVDGQSGIRLVSGGGTVTLAGGTVFGGGVLLDRPIDAGIGSIALLAGSLGGDVQQTATGGVTAGSLGVTASAGTVDLATAGAVNAVGSVTGFGRDGFRFRAAGPVAVGAGGIATTNAPLTLVSGGGLTIGGALAAGDGTVRLRALAGDIVQTGGAIAAAGLAALADVGAIDLGLAGNAIGTVAGSAQGPLAVRAGGALTVGTIGADGALVPALEGVRSVAAAVTLEADGPLAVSGPVRAGTDVALAAGTAGMVVSGTVEADGVIALDTPGAIAVTAGGAIDAGGEATLTAGAAVAIDAGAVVRSGGGLGLAAGTALTVAGTAEAGADASLTAGAGLLVTGTVAAEGDAALAAGQDIAVSGLADAGGGVSLDAGQAIDLTGTVRGATATLAAGTSLTQAGLVQTAGDAALSAGGTLAIAPAGTIDAGGDATVASGGAMTVAGSIAAGATARLAAGGALAVPGEVAGGLDAVLAAGGDLGIAGTVTAGRNALVGTDGSATIGGGVAVGAGGRLIVGFGADFTLSGSLAAPGGRIMVRRAEQTPGGSGAIRFEGGPDQLSSSGDPELVVIDASGDLRPLGAPDPGTDVGQLLGMLNLLRVQTPDEIAANRIVRLNGTPSLVAHVTSIQTEFGSPADASQSTVAVDLGQINAPGSLLYVFGENGSVQSAPTSEALRLRAAGVYVGAAAGVALFGVINGVGGDPASTYVQRLGDPQFSQVINDCAIGTIGCTFLPLAQIPVLYVPPVLALEGGAPRLDESAVPIINTGPEESLRQSAEAGAGRDGQEDEQAEAAAAAPRRGGTP